MNKQETLSLENQVAYIQHYFRLGGIYTGQGYGNLGWNGGGRFNALEELHLEFCVLVSDAYWELGLEADELHWLLGWYGLGYDEYTQRHDYHRMGLGVTPRRSHTQFPFRRDQRINLFCRTYPFEILRRDMECMTVEMSKAIAEDVKSQTKDIKESIDWEIGYRETAKIFGFNSLGYCRWDTLGGINDDMECIRHDSAYRFTTYNWRRRIQLENKLGFTPPNLPIFDSRTDYDLITKNTFTDKTLAQARRHFYGIKDTNYGGDIPYKRKR